jgi:NAD(P)-dependent dehydrogenase (short-subunit alcohol dehydrogenase family)
MPASIRAVWWLKPPLSSSTICLRSIRARPLLCAEAAIRAFRLQKSGGAIVTVGSINAYCGLSNLTVYSMSKGALMTMTRNLANTLGPELIRVNQLNVGWTFTAIP